MTHFNFDGQLLSLDKPLVMGILNITPDSFFDGGRYQSELQIVHQAEEMLKQGADFIDIGAYSTRPNGSEVSVDEELERLSKAMLAIRKTFPQARLSIDTFRAQVVERLYDSFGVFLVNDISAGSFDSDMFATVGRLHLPYCMMHLQGTQQTMHQQYSYKNITQEINQYFSSRIYEAHQNGIADLFIDPGFGFSKSLDQNYALLAKLEQLSILQKPLLVGISRKSMIWRTLGVSPQEALNGTTALNMIALQKGAKVLRVHEVKEACECIKLWNAVDNQLYCKINTVFHLDFVPKYVFL